MNQRLNIKRQLLWTTVASLSAMFGIVTHRAAEDRRLDETCTPFDHQYLCAHRWPDNPSMCKTDVPFCNGASDSNICASTEISYYEVKDDFPQSDPLDPTLTCTQIVGGSGVYTVWNSHTKIVSPPAQCYKRVYCVWDPSTQPGKCVYYADAGPWISKPKPTLLQCL